jgi:hypothetical protein
MPLISERIPDLLGGVSQRAQTQRQQNEVERAVNTMAHPSLGLMLRPPTRHGAILSLSPGDWPGAYSFPVEYDFNQRYRIVLTDGELLAYDVLSGEPVTVDFPDGTSYLDTDGADPLAVFRAVSIEGRTYILNRSRLIQQDTVKSDTRSTDCLIVVRQADFATRYSITLFPAKTITYTTPVGVTASSRSRISTEEIAGELVARLTADPFLALAYNIEQYGASIHIEQQSTSRLPILVGVQDGLSDEGLMLIRGKVKSFDLLPSVAPEGYIVEVESSPTSPLDNSWYEFDSDTQTWVETAKPGEPLGLYAPSMPHELVSKRELLKNATHIGSPEAPAIDTAGGTTYTGTWAASLNGAASNGSPVIIKADAAAMYSNMASIPAAASSVELRVKYNIDCTNLEPTNIVTVSLYVNNGAASTTWSLVESQSFPAGEYFFDEELSGEAAALQQNYDIKLELSYAVAPVSGREAVLGSFQSSARNPGFRYKVLDLTRITFPDDVIYPSGVTYTLTVNGTAFAYTPTVDRTGRQMALAFQPLIDANASLVASVDGSAIDVDLVGSQASPTAVWTTNYAAGTTFHDPDLSLTVNELVGLTLVNLTDGSSGVVASNAATTVTVASLTGGYGNTFERDDRIEVQDLPDEFVFKQVDWDERLVGSVELDPFPQFVGRRGSTIFFHRGRLGITAGDFVCLSEAGNPRNWFRASVSALLDSDPIGVKPTRPAGTFHSAISLDDRLFLFTDSSQYELDASGDVLSPASVRMRKTTDYRSSPQAEVVELGRHAAFAYDHFGHGQVELYGALPEAARTYEARGLTRAIPRYLEGKVKQLAGFDSSNILFVLTDDDAESVGLPGMTADPFLSIQSSVIAPTPPAPPPPPPNTSEDDVALTSQRDAVLIVGTESVSDISGVTPDTFDESASLSASEDMDQEVSELGVEMEVSVAETVTITGSESKVDEALAPEVTSAALGTYGDYIVGGIPEKSRASSVVFSFAVDNALSARVEVYDPSDVLLQTTDYDSISSPYDDSFTINATTQGVFRVRVRAYSETNQGGTASAWTTVYTGEMNEGIA